MDETKLNTLSGKVKVEIEIPRRFLAYQCGGADIGYWAGNVKTETVLTSAQNENLGSLDLITEVDEVDERTGKVVAHHVCDWARAVKLAIEINPGLLDESRMDMTTGDVWVQLAALGEVRYG